MPPSRRKLLGLLGTGVTAGLAGCPLGYQDLKPEKSSGTGDGLALFNEDGELTSPVNNEYISTALSSLAPPRPAFVRRAIGSV
jgi:hypothetical protein